MALCDKRSFYSKRENILYVDRKDFIQKLKDTDVLEKKVLESIESAKSKQISRRGFLKGSVLATGIATLSASGFNFFNRDLIPDVAAQSQEQTSTKIQIQANSSQPLNYYFETTGAVRKEEFRRNQQDTSQDQARNTPQPSNSDDQETIGTEAGVLGHKAVSPEKDENLDPRNLDVDGNKYYVSTDGNDSNQGSYENPWKTPRKAANEAKPGDKVFFRGGEYVLQERMQPNSGEQNRKITFRNFPGEEPVLNAENLSYDWGGVVFIRDKSNIVIDGLKLENSDKFGIHILRSPNCTVKNCHIDRAHGAGIEAQGSNNVSIKYNEVTRSSFGGDQWPAQSEIISVSRAPNPDGDSLITDGFEVIGNLIHEPADRTKEGLDVHSGARNGVVAFNTIRDTERLGLYIGGGQFMARNIDVFGNVVENCLHGVVLSSEEGGDVQNIRIFKNLFYNNEYDGIWVTSFREEAYENIDNTQKDIYIYNNTSVKNQRNGFRMTERYDNVVVKNNIFAENGQDQITNNTSANVSFGYNCSYGPGGQADGEGAVNENPQFVDTANNNFKLQSGSPCIDAGTSDLSEVPKLESRFDIAGEGIDIGAYEETGQDTGTTEDMKNGVYLTGYEKVRQFEEYQDASVDIVSTTYTEQNASQWHNPMTYMTFEQPKKFIDEGGEIILSIGMVPKGGIFQNEGYKEAKDGKYVDDWRKMAQAFVDAGVADSIILRPEGEYNFSWQDAAWIGTNAPDPQTGAEWFKQTWRLYHDTIKEVTEDIRLVINPNYKQGPVPFEETYPGDEYVWGVGPDFYDRHWNYEDGVNNPQDAEASWQHKLTVTEGLQYYRDFAQQHNKELIFPEWGLWKRWDMNTGGGDNPLFVEKFLNWVSQQDAYAQCYWLDQDEHGFWTTNGAPLPNAAQKWKEMMQQL